MTEIVFIASIILNIITITYFFVTTKRKKLHNESQKEASDKISSNERTISCPSCSQQIKFRIPIRGNKAKCKKCSTKFKLEVDANGNIYITEIKKAEDNKNSVTTLDECYAILDIKPDSIALDIKAAYKKKISEYHPDKVENLGIKIKQVAEDETRRINAAYSMLQENERV